MSINAKTLVELLRGLVAIDSVNPTLVPGARGEAELSRFLRDWLRAHGIPAELQEVAPGRPNVVGRLGPPGVRPVLAFVGHVDTVGAGDMREPFTPREQNGRLYGRGAMDMKAGVAAMCAAAAALLAEGVPLQRPLLVAGVVDEEMDSIGAQALVREYSADAAVVTEPTDLTLGIAHKGFQWFEVTTHGRSAHGSRPEEGRDAICMMGRVLAALEALDARLARRPPHPLLGRASVHASLISGGQELSSYPAECRLQLERRTLPGETQQQTEAEMARLVADLHADDAGFRATLQAMTYRSAYEADADAPILRATAEAIRQVCGSVQTSGMSFWADTAILAAAAIPSVLFGPRGQGLHSAEEYVELDSVLACAEVLRALALRLCA